MKEMNEKERKKKRKEKRSKILELTCHNDNNRENDEFDLL